MGMMSLVVLYIFEAFIKIVAVVGHAGQRVRQAQLLRGVLEATRAEEDRGFRSPGAVAESQLMN